MSLRDYQEVAVSEIKKKFLQGSKKVLLVMPTGSGKTVVFCEIIKQSLLRNKKSAIVTRGRKLVDQASQRLFREDVPHGVMMAGHWNNKPSYPVQSCSVDTVISRGIDLSRFDILIVDEAHLFTKGTKAGDVIENFKGFVVAVTATPYVDTGLDHLAESIVRPISMQQLVEQNHLVPFRYFAPSEPDLRAVRTVRGDYKNDQLEGAMTKGQLTGDIIKHWKNIAVNRPTICFAVNIHHSKILEEKFNEAGIPAKHCDADSTDEERNEVIRRLEKGEIKVICNVGIFCTGIDIGCIGAIILARPTKSYNLFVQQIGRGTRLSSGKSDCILLDHAGNIIRHGFPTMEPEVDLSGIPKRETTSPEFKTCKNCFALYIGKICPDCGEEPAPVEKKQILESDEELTEITVSSKSPEEQWLEYLEQQRKKTNRKNGWQFYKLVDKFGYEKVEHLLPFWFRDRYKMKQQTESKYSEIIGGIKWGR